jgi:5-methylcytosine-specific restriction endonuclease McrA
MTEKPDPNLVLLEPLLGPIVVASLSNQEMGQRLDILFRLRSAVEGRIVEMLGEVERRESYRDEGATSAEPWMVERFGVSQTTARAYMHVAEQAWDFPHLTASLCEGEISFDKMRTLIGVATPETDRELREQAKACSVRELAELARAERGPALERRAEKDYELRSLRFNDQFRTVTAQLPPENYVETKSYLEARARELPSDGETPWDQRLCDAFLQTIRSSSGGGPCEGGDAGGGYFVVAHVPLTALVDESGEATELAGDLERGELVSCETLRRIACDATITIAVDDDGHTMYEGRARRDPTGAQRREVWRRDRHCRFPGCTNQTFTNVHHIVPWKPNGLTDLDNLALLCEHHHHRVHSKQWRLSGDANKELTFVGPTGRPMVSRPSPKWTAATDGRADPSGESARPGRAPTS